MYTQLVTALLPQWLHSSDQPSQSSVFLTMTCLSNILTYSTLSPQYLKHLYSPSLTQHYLMAIPHRHFQLLLPFQLQLPSITQNLLPLPSLPSINLTETGSPITIPIPTNYPIHSQCLFKIPHTHLPNSFCPHPCDPHCQHHYNAFRPITLSRALPFLSNNYP